MFQSNTIDDYHTHGRHLLASDRVLGLGYGAFTLAVTLVVSVVLCVCGSRGRKPGVIYAGSTALFATVFIILVAAPKGPREVVHDYGYDVTVIPRAIVLSLLILGALLGPVGMLIFHVTTAIYARPLSYHADILMQQ